MTRRQRVTLATLGAAALMTGCGGGEPAPVVDRDATLQLTLTEYAIKPGSIRVKAPRGDRLPVRIHIVARNRGRLTHNVKIESLVPEAEQGTDEQPVIFGGTPTAQPGTTVSSAPDVFLQPGTYRMTDTIANHDNLGQYGTLVVFR